MRTPEREDLVMSSQLSPLTLSPAPSVEDLRMSSQLSPLPASLHSQFFPLSVAVIAF